MSDSTENTNELDSYGVWVKNSQDDNAAPAGAEEPEMMNFSDSLDLPEFDESPASNADDLNIFDQAPALNTSLDTNSEDTTLNTDELMNITNGVDIVETDESGHSLDDSSDNLSFDMPKEEPVVEDLNFDMPTEETSVEEPVLEETSFDLPSEEPVVEDASFDIPAPESISDDLNFDMPSEEPAVTEDAGFEIPSAEPTLEETNFDIPTDVPATEEVSFDMPGDSAGSDSEGETELSLDDFMDGGFSDESVASGNNGYEPGAEGSPSSASSEEVSLDDFLDGGFEEDKKQEEVVVDEKPLEMDISFDNSTDTIQTEENTSINEDYDDDDPIETAYEEAGIATEETKVSEEENTTIAASTAESFDSEEVDLSDFGIDADAEETPVTQDVAEAKNVEKVVDYDLSVSNETTSSAPVVNVIQDNNDKVEDMAEVEDLQALPPENSTQAVETSLLRQIVDDLAGLKSEINRLKTNLSEMKDKESGAANFASLDDIGIEETKDEGGFFGGDDGDDTIALSNDELNNIMTTADFNSVDEPATTDVEESVDMPVDVIDNGEPEFEETAVDASETITDEDNFGIPMVKDSLAEEFAENVENETLIEPNLDNIDVQSSDVTEESEDLPEEISIEKDDDILVESSDSDSPETFTDVFDEAAPAEENDIFDSVNAPFATDEPNTTITESNLDYLTSENKPADEGALDSNSELKKDIKSVLLYMDQLLENLPEDKIVEFAKSEEFSTYKKLFSELGLS